MTLQAHLNDGDSYADMMTMIHYCSDINAFNAVKLLHQNGNRLRIIVCIPGIWISNGNCLDGFSNRSFHSINQSILWTCFIFIRFNSIILHMGSCTNLLLLHSIFNGLTEQKREKEAVTDFRVCIFFQCESNHCINWKSNSFRP